MNVSFDYFKNLEDIEFYLCNPDMAEIGAIIATNRSITLRFNDLSEASFEAPKFLIDASGNKVESPYYSRIETKRLIKMDKIGWFQIVEATEVEDGYNSYKNVRLESHQTILKDRGIYTENRVYKFYDPEDPTDSNYDAGDEAQLPSVIGQLYRQLGIQIRFSGVNTTSSGSGEWTIVYIPSEFIYNKNSSSNICRTMKDSDVKYGYDFIVNDVSDAFEVIFDFDILNHTISVKTVDDVTQRTGIYLSFDNLVKTLEVTEKAEDIVTVLNCNGQDINIQPVNPTGMNYIVDFSYYMDEVNHQWMSSGLISRIKQWEAAVNAQKSSYKSLVRELMGLYQEHTELISEANLMSLRISDTEAARDQYITDMEGTAGMPFVCGTVKDGECSGDPNSNYYTTPFSTNGRNTFYNTPPAWDEENEIFVFPEDGGEERTYSAAYTSGYLYFSCSTTGRSYGKLFAEANVDPDSGLASYEVAGFEENAAYQDVAYWLDLYAKQYDTLKSSVASKESEIESVNTSMSNIASSLNILNYFSSYPDLYRELRYYWIEGNYENENIACLDSTTLDEELSLAEELMEAGERELSRVCQPRFSFTLTSVNFLSLIEFQEYSSELELGRVITIEKSPELWYYPALTAMSFNLDNPDEFELTFSNAYKLSDWGFTYADLVTSAADTSRVVSSNWTELTSYSKDKEDIEDLLYNPLDKTLRMAQSNMVNQDFVIDTTGILGRKRVESGSTFFEDEQIRIINNVILFTDDGWKHAKTALGKIIYTDEEGDHIAYGLLAEVVVGSLMMSNTLKIVNEENSILLDEGGITIKNQEGEAVFYAKTNGDVSIKGDIYATSLTLGSDVSIPSGSVGGLDGALDDLDNKIDNTTSDLTDKINQAVGSLEGALGDLEGSVGDLEDSVDGVHVEIDQVNGLVTEVTTNVGTLQGILDQLGDYIDNFVVGWINPDTGELGKIPDGLIDEETGELIGGQDITAFFVSKDGLLQASNAIIWGEIYASGGTIGGIRIRDNAIESVNGVFELTEDGKLICSDAEISGEVNASSGTIGGLTISENSIASSNGNFSIDKEGNIYSNSLTLGSGVKIPTENVDGLDEKFEGYIAVDGTVGTTPSEGATGFVVSSDGLLQASNAVIYGAIYASRGTIAGLIIESGQVSSDSGVAIQKTIRTPSDEFNIRVTETTDGNLISSVVNMNELFCDEVCGRNSSNKIDLSYTEETTIATATISYSRTSGLITFWKVTTSSTTLKDEKFSVEITITDTTTTVAYSQEVIVPKGKSSVEFIAGATIYQTTVVFVDTQTTMKQFILGDPDLYSISITGNVIPGANSTYSFGNEYSRWHEGHFDSLYIGGAAAGTQPIVVRAESDDDITVEIEGTTSSIWTGVDVIDFGSLQIVSIVCGKSLKQDQVANIDISGLKSKYGWTSYISCVATPRFISKDPDLSYNNVAGTLAVSASISRVSVACDSGNCESGFSVWALFYNYNV